MNIWVNKQAFMFFLILSILSFSARLDAVEVQLYQIELPVQNQTGNFDQKALLKEALQAVLVRISGSRQCLNTPEATNALTSIDTYVKQFSYHQRSALEKTIKVIFNQNRVNALLNSTKQSVWNKNRPLTLVWLDGADKDQPLALIMEKILNQRAIPSVFPLMDLTDTALVSDQDLMGEGTAVLEAAAKRYNPDVILFGRLEEKNGIWQTHWRFINPNKPENTTWTHAGAELNVVLNQALDSLTLHLKSSNIVVAPTESAEKTAVNHLILTVSGSVDVQQYNTILEHLRRLPAVLEAEVAQIMPDKTLFELLTTQSKEALINAIADGHVLTRISNTSGATAEEDAMIYELAGVL